MSLFFKMTLVDTGQARAGAVGAFMLVLIAIGARRARFIWLDRGSHLSGEGRLRGHQRLPLALPPGDDEQEFEI